MKLGKVTVSGLLVVLTCMCSSFSDPPGADSRADFESSADGGHAKQTKETERTYQLTHLAVFTYVWGPAARGASPRGAAKTVRFWFGERAESGPSHGSIGVKTVDLGESDTDRERVAELTALHETEYLRYGQAKNLPLRALEAKLGFAYSDGARRKRSFTILALECDGKPHKRDVVAPGVLEFPAAEELCRGLVVTYVCSRIDAVQNGFAACARADQDCDGAITLADLDEFAVDLQDEERRSVFDEERLNELLGIFDDCAGYRDLAFSPDWGSWGRRGPT